MKMTKCAAMSSPPPLCTRCPAPPTRARGACWRRKQLPHQLHPWDRHRNEELTAMSFLPEFVRNVVCANISVNKKQASLFPCLSPVWCKAQHRPNIIQPLTGNKGEERRKSRPHLLLGQGQCTLGVCRTDDLASVFTWWQVQFKERRW